MNASDKYLDTVDFSHPMTTARRHIEMICAKDTLRRLLERTA